MLATQTAPCSLGIGIGASVGALCVLFAIVVVIIVAIEACCNRCLLKTLLKNTPVGPRSVILDEQLPYKIDDIKKLAERVEALERQIRGQKDSSPAEEDTAHGPPRMSKSRTFLCCRETERERQARETYEEIEHLLQKDSIRRVLEGSSSANGVNLHTSLC